MLEIRATTGADWEVLKAVRLAALLDAPTAFGVLYASAAGYTDAQWRERASSGRFLLAFMDGGPAGIVGGVVSPASEFNLIAMWVAPAYRGTAVAAGFVEAIKARAISQGHARVVLDVSPCNVRAAAFYRKLDFASLPEWETLESHPDIKVQKMVWNGS